MSLWSLLTATAVLPADLVSAGIVAATAQVYPGRREQHVTVQSGEVWLEEVGGDQVGTGFQHAWSVTIRVHYRTARGNAGGNKTGAAQLVESDAKVDVIAKRYASAIPFLAVSGLSGLLPVSVTNINRDEDPENEAVHSSSVDLTFRLKE